MTKQLAATAEDADLEALLAFIRDSRGFDFTGYKRSTLSRRIRKRMKDVGVDEYADYQDRLESSAEEFELLFDTILINVTSFFRDAEAWAYLQSDILPEVLAHLEPVSEVRVWSAGCSSGEEPYSLAIAFAEAMGIEECVRRVKIYGTDVDDDALRMARSGVYKPEALESMDESLRKKYFEPSGGNFAFRSDLRRRVIFGRHDITNDAPISRLDLLVCRNTMMYFNVESQSQIIDRFHFALAESGYLFLGKAEMLLSNGDRFEAANIRHRMFRRRPGPAWADNRPPARLPTRGNLVPRPPSREHALNDLAFEAAPFAMVTIDQDDIVAAVNGQARTMFGLSTQDAGRPLRDLEISYRPVELRSMIERAYAERRAVRVSSAERSIGPDDVQYLDVHVQPLWSGDGVSIGAVVIFFDRTVATRLQREVKRNREELETAYEELQSTNEELETTNEELQSSIEELETTNEELQSTNEELETTNEELQSGNEELETMNEEMRERTTELDEARAFLEGVLSSVAAAVVVLDAELTVRSWNRGAIELWGLRADEAQGHAFFSLDFGLPTESLRRMVQQCRETGRRAGPIEVEAVNRIGRTIVCSVNCAPLDGSRGGLVLLMEEISRG
ncbi:MAG TPA: CheR family methyltransferase [Nocardioidaceae bacterium]|nr:CheR family methyltransferase [Nocardioidaceae bacterium]